MKFEHIVFFAFFFPGNLLSGIATFMPKFIEAQFALSASTAAQYVGKTVMFIINCTLKWLN